MEINAGKRDFELTVHSNEINEEITIGSRIFIPGTEYGGILGEKKKRTSESGVTFLGYTWRGRLAKKVIVPPEGKDYYTVSGELNEILREMIEPAFGGLFVVPQIDTGIETSYQFNRFVTMLDGFTAMLKEVGYRLEIKYNMGEPNGTGWVEVYAVPIKDFSDEIELSNDSNLEFEISEKKDGVTHLIAGGKGDLQERNVIHLYVQEDGSIGKSQYYTAENEIEEFYENTSADSSELEKKAIEKLEELMNKKEFHMDVAKLGIDVSIGDIIGGREYETGIKIKQPIKNIIIKISNGKMSKEYEVEGN